jgi:hypothetical protein
LQQSLQHPHFRHKWLPQASFVQFTQMVVDCSSQMLHMNGML